MRIYIIGNIIGNGGITLCREPPATVNEGEIAVASSEELHAARLSDKRLLALWNALPGVEKRETGRPRRNDRSAVVGDREVAGPGAAIRPEAPIEAGRGDCDAVSARGGNGSRRWRAPRAGSAIPFAASSREP